MNTHAASSTFRAALARGWTPFSTGMAIILCAIYLALFGFRALVQFDVTVESGYSSFFKIYWASGDDGFTESKMREVYIKPGKTTYSVFLTNLALVERLRIDPLEYPGKVSIRKLDITQAGYAVIDLLVPTLRQRLKPVRQSNPVASSGGAMVLETLGEDGQYEIAIDPERHTVFPFIHTINLLLIIAAVYALRRVAAYLVEDNRLVPAMLAAVLVMVAVMASVTHDSVHPDEKVHLSAVNYYSEHLLPPRIDDPALADSFSGYGYSRLANLEIYYQLAGYFSALLKPLRVDNLLGARIFGIAMLLVLVILCLRYPPFRDFTVPMLVSAQAWYLFSYTNSDGFALFYTIITSYQVAYRDSALNRFLLEAHPDRFWPKALVFGAGAGLLLLLKPNFYFFILFLGLYLLWRVTSGDFPDQKQLWTRLVMIGVVGLCVYGARTALDYAVNGPDPGQLRAEMIELHSDPLYKPSTPVHNKHIYLDLRERGFTLDRIIVKERWLGKTFLSAFGSFGFTQYFPSSTYYEQVRNIGLLLVGLLLGGVLIFGTPRTSGLFIIVLVCSTLLVVTLLWRSWTVSFQPQGRYLAPILPMAGILYYHVQDTVNRKVFLSLIFALFLMGVYAFVFVGLHGIPKIDYYS
jgi:hypothetical protein